jgi:hypothetical protein
MGRERASVFATAARGRGAAGVAVLVRRSVNVYGDVDSKSKEQREQRARSLAFRLVPRKTRFQKINNI